MEGRMSYLIGEVLAGRYRVDAYLGEGGMAQVYRAWDSERTAPLALKLLRADLAQDAIFLRRFRREAVVLERLQHPNIVRTYGFEQDDLLAFIVMDYISGSNLRTEIFRSQGSPLAGERILELLRPTCGALHYAHRNGIAHCDVKPANILIEDGGRVLLSDFGVARTTENATAMTAVSLGTPAYMAPEQIRGEDATPATDIYSVGVVLYEMLTGGERPFTGERAGTTGSVSEKVRWEHLHLDPPSLCWLNPGLSPHLEAVVKKCLEKDPKRRYDDPIALLEALEASLPRATGDMVTKVWMVETSTVKVKLDSKPSAPTALPENTLSHQTLPQTPQKRQRRLAWFATPAAAVLLGWHYLQVFVSKL
jgi:eukaryotic-like serine/threonine-protein kinase